MADDKMTPYKSGDVKQTSYPTGYTKQTKYPTGKGDAGFEKKASGPLAADPGKGK